MPTSKKRLTLWLLNRVVGWDRSRLLGALSARYEVRLGQRVVSIDGPGAGPDTLQVDVNEGEYGAPGELMHEGAALAWRETTRYDEYFVPIPIKCIGEPGSPFWEAVAGPAGRNLLADLQAHMARRFPNGSPFEPEKANRIIGPHFGPVRMNLVDRSIGYYQMLKKATEQTGAMNLLVGYSQGGTVARYLAFLDEHVVRREERCIHGVITVQAPNRGSPVACGSKELDISRALQAILLSLPGWLPENFRQSRIWTYLNEAARQNSLIDFTNGLLDAEIDSWPVTEANRRLLETWLTARKWLSGVSGVADLAFYDLDPLRLDEKGTVLNAIDTKPLEETPHGAVIGTDNRLHAFVQALLAVAPWYVRLVAWLRRGWLEDMLAIADDIYKHDAMSFPQPVVPEGGVKAVRAQYESGLSRGTLGLSGDIGRFAHDFLIPSASQLLVPETKSHLGNLVNDRASHLTGAERFPSGDGQTDEDHVVSLLRRM